MEIRKSNGIYILLPGARLGCVYITDQWALTPWSSGYLHRGGRCTSLDGSDFKTSLKMKKLRTIFALIIMNEYLLILLIRSRVIVLKDLPYKVLRVVSFGIFLRDYSQSWIHGKPIKGFSRIPLTWLLGTGCGSQSEKDLSAQEQSRLVGLHCGSLRQMD